MSERIQKKLADSTLKKREILEKRKFNSSGIRELDEMLGGGFQNDSLTLFQQDIGSSGEVFLRQIIENQLSVTNVVLVILTDAVSRSLIYSIPIATTNPNLIILDLVEKGVKDVNLYTNKHEISLQIRSAREKALTYVNKRRSAEQDYSIQCFTFIISINPFILNLSSINVIQLIQDNLNLCCDSHTCDLILMNKDIVSNEMLSQIQTLCHNVVDLSSKFEGIAKQQYIRILKMVGHYMHDNRIEPYKIQFDEKTENYTVIIKSAFLNTFEAFRNLIDWEKGTLEFSSIPFLLLPARNWMEIITKIEDLTKLESAAYKIGVDFSGFVQNLYMTERWETVKTTLRVWSLLGWGECVQIKKDLSHKIVEYRHTFNPEIKADLFIPILKGLYSGIISQSLKLTVKQIDMNLKATENNTIADLIIIFE